MGVNSSTPPLCPSDLSIPNCAAVVSDVDPEFWCIFDVGVWLFRARKCVILVILYMYVRHTYSICVSL